MALVTLGSSFQTVITTAVDTYFEAKRGTVLLSTESSPATDDDAARLLIGDSIILPAGVVVKARTVDGGVLFHMPLEA